jgi:plasmid stabilization system protein ParE
VKPRVVFHVLADRELNDAARYYEQECPGLGTAFLAEVERCTDSILEHPEAGTLVQADVRRRILSRFPYGILYRVLPDHVRVLAIMNLRRRPFYWRGRR